MVVTVSDEIHARDMPGIRFGVTVAPETSANRWKDKVRAIEDSPFDVLLVNDHLSGFRFAPMLALSAAAEITSRLRLGTIVLANDYRHPALLAKEAATLDLLSDGRLELGLGAGWMRSDYDQAGIPFDPAKVRIARLREAIDILRGAWGGEPFTYQGEHFQVTDLDLDPRPIQKPNPPLHLGGGGPVMLRYAAREADIVNITTRTAADGRGVDAGDVGLPPLLKKLNLVREAAGDRWERLAVSVGVRATAINRPLGSVHPAVAAQVDALRGTPFLLEGDVDAVAEQILYWYHEHRISYFILGNDTEAKDMYPVIEQVRTQLDIESRRGGTHA